ncbi:MAG: adenine-specific methyltransferase EcoRI family protein [bacterium]
MGRKVDHTLLAKAKRNKNDEFYTQLIDIENELKHYQDHFRNKVIFCNCDDPRVSNFFNYFVANFERLRIKKLITACYRKKENDIFSTSEIENGFFFEYTGREKGVDFTKITHFEGDGDFRSSESIKLLQESDIVVTNPPFSLFREYVAQLINYDKKFLIIGNINAITYKEIFNLIQVDKVWLGVNLGRGISGFIVPDHYELYGTETKIDHNGNKIVSPNNCLWLTNLDICRRHEKIVLTKSFFEDKETYPKYDNYDGINVSRTKDIPVDYAGHIGVPITFLHKYNPEQFKIIKFRKGNDNKDLSVKGKCPYFRILIKNLEIANG